MVLQVKLPYLDSLDDLSYPTEGDKIQVFLNGDYSNPIGICQLLTDDTMLALLWLNQEVSKDLFVYYMKDAGVTDCFEFAGLDLREKPLRKAPWRQSLVIQMPRFLIDREKRTKRLKEVMVWGR